MRWLRRDLAAGVSRPDHDETVWNDAEGATGGGVSVEFALPSYQAQARVPDNVETGSPGRGVPDVAGDADPQTGYAIRVDGVDQVVGGTSAVAPLWAGLVALLNESLGHPLGFAQPRLYSAAGSFATSRAATTAPTTPAQAGTRAPASALPTARRCCPPCREARAGSGEPPLAPPVTTTALASAPRALANGREQRPDVRRHVVVGAGGVGCRRPDRCGGELRLRRSRLRGAGTRCRETCSWFQRA